MSINLNGHKITGNGYGTAGIDNDGYIGLKVKNGTISGFDSAIMQRLGSLRVFNMTLCGGSFAALNLIEVHDGPVRVSYSKIHGGIHAIETEYSTYKNRYARSC